MRNRFLSLCKPVGMALMLGLLSACAVVQQGALENIGFDHNTREGQARWRVHQANANQIEAWEIKGKIAVKAGNKGGHATIRWKKRETEHIELYGPLGGGRVQIDADSTGVWLKDTKGAELQGDSVSALIEQRLGWPLPFDQLPYWLRGLPASPDANMQWDELGRIVRMNDQGWQVSYPEYQFISVDGGEPIAVPRMIELNALPGTLRVYDNDGQYLGEEFFVRLIVKSWFS